MGERTARDTAGIEAGTTRSKALDDRELGTGEVHGDIHVNREEGYSAIAASGAGPRERGGESLKDRAVNRTKELGDEARSRAQGMARDVQNRVSGAASQAQQQADQALHRAEDMLEERGILTQIRNHPLPALGIAFGVGFLLAGGGDEEEEREPRRRGKKRKAKGGGMMDSVIDQAKGALVGSLSAALATQARSLMGMAQGGGGQGGLLDTLMENLQGGGKGQSGTSRRNRPPSHQESY